MTNQRNAGCIDSRRETPLSGKRPVTSPTNQSGSLCHLHIPDGSYLQRKLCPFVLFSDNHGNRQAGFDAPDLWAMVRMRDIELLNESHQECLDLYDTAPKPVFSGAMVQKMVNPREPPPNTAPNASGE